MKNYVVGIDLGGTKISCALADLEGNVKAQHTTPTNAHEGEQAVLDRIIGCVETVICEGKVTIDEVEAIGIGSPGPLDARTGIIITTPNLPFKNFNLVSPLKAKFGIPVYLDNDANVAAIGEFMLGAGKGTENMIYMGCLEAVSSGTAIGKRGREAVATNVETSLKDYDNVTSYEVFVEAAKGDRVAKSIIDEALNYLGIGVANAIATFDPDMVVIGGGVSKAGEVVFETVQEVVNERCFKAMAEHCKIVPAGLGTDAGVIGAVALALLECK